MNNKNKKFRYNFLKIIQKGFYVNKITIHLPVYMNTKINQSIICAKFIKNIDGVCYMLTINTQILT